MVHWLINKGRLSGGSLMRLQQINHFSVTFGTKQCLEMGRTRIPKINPNLLYCAKDEVSER
jgi:hypothetical protein